MLLVLWTADCLAWNQKEKDLCNWVFWMSDDYIYYYSDSYSDLVAISIVYF